MLDWIVLILLVVAWSTVLVLLHELGHAIAALAVTDGEVSIELRHAGLSGGSITFDEGRVRSRRGLIAIVAAGPAVSFAAAVVLSLLWLADPSLDRGVVSVGASIAVSLFVLTALPVRYGAGMGIQGDSDGLVIWKLLTGGPRREVEHGPTRWPVFVLLAGLAVTVTFLLGPMYGIWLVGLFGFACWLERSGVRG